MIPSEYGSSAPTAGEVVLQQVRDDEPAALEELRALERAREQLQLRELHRLVDVPEDTVHVGAGLDELGREPQRLRGRVRVLEPAGVGDEPDVERLGDLRRQRRRRAGRAGRARSRPSTRRASTISVDVAEARVVVVMVDVDARARRPRRPGCPRRSAARSHSRRRAARARRGRRAGRASRRRRSRKPYSAGSRRGAGEVHDDVLAERAQAERRRQHRAERVAVGVLVRRRRRTGRAADRRRDRLELSCAIVAPPPPVAAGRLQARRSASSCRRRARRTHRRRT